MKLNPKLKTALKGFLSLLTILKYIPLPSQWRGIIITVTTIVSSIVAVLDKCDVSLQAPPHKQIDPTPLTPQPTPSPTRTMTPSPTPFPQIIVPTRITAGEPFIVKVSALFEYNTNLVVDRFHLCILGQQYKTKLMSCTVTLWTAGRRTLHVTLSNGSKLEKIIDVEKAGLRTD